MSLAVVLADQWVKFVVVEELTSHLDGKRSLGEKLTAFYGKAPAQSWDGYHLRSKRFITVSDSYLRLRYAENPGAAWGLFRTLPEHIRGPLFDVVSLGAVVLITRYFLKLKGVPGEGWIRWGLPLVLGGAVGNFVDRLARGFVVDFVEAHWFDSPTLIWPSFNVADVAICVGVGMLMVDSLVRREKPSPRAAAS